MIRPARRSDAAAVAAIWNPLIRDTAVTFNPVEKTVEELAEVIAGHRASGFGFVVADDRAAVRGFACYGQFRGGAGYRHTMEHTVHVAPEARGVGVGAALMAALEAHATGQGVHSMIAGVSAENPAGRAFHAALGYSEIAFLPEVGHKFGRWIGLHLMQKILLR